jgi:hypothetical protein
MKKKTALKLVTDELTRARAGHVPMHSAHEGFAVLQEEVDELWEEIKGNQGTTHRGISEAVQTAAMALRYLIDLCDEPAAAQHETKVRTHYASVPDGGWGSGSYSG